MSADDKDEKGWGRRLDGLIKRVGDEVGGERGEKVRTRLTEAKSRVEAGLESDDVRRLRGDMATLGDKAMDRVDDALRHEHTQAVVKRVDAALTEIGDRLRGETTEDRPGRSSPEASEPAARPDEVPVEADEIVGEPDEETTIRDAAPSAGDVSPAVSSNGEDETPPKSA